MQIYAALKSDHKIVKQILKQLDATSESTPEKRLRYLKQLKEALVPHSRAEERVFYDRLKHSEVEEADDLAFEGYEEHAVVDSILAKLETTPPNEKRWTALISVAKELLEHHIQEEEGTLFKKAKQSFDRRTTTEMAEEFSKLKTDFLKQLKAGNLPEQGSSDGSGGMAEAA